MTRNFRLFIAIRAPVELRKEIADWQARSNLNVRWLPPGSLHITLIPPFYADEKGLEAVKEKCRSRKPGTGPFLVQFNTVSFGPERRNPRLIWASGEAPAELISFKKLLKDKFDNEKNDKKLRLHLTIARFKPESFRSFKQKKLNEPVDWKGTVSNFSLISSKLTPAGAIYDVIENIML